ncbi:hypothetical protein ACFLSX_05935, partial [Calditrichota bacterium]
VIKNIIERIGMSYLPSVSILFLFFVGSVIGQDSTRIKELEKRISQLEQKLEQEELRSLLNDAESIAEKKVEKQETKVFTGGERSLQALNPEISLAADVFGMYINNENGFTETSRSGAHFRVAELQIQSTLDPFSMAKVILEFTPEEVEFAEAYVSWSRIFKNASLTAGKFRQQFGVVNRWHAHALDQFKFPLPITTLLGEEGLNQIGLSFDWLMPAITAHSNMLTVQVTNGQNDHLFSGEAFSFPAVLAHLKNYYDLSQNTYLEFGLTGMMGRNNIRGFEEDSLILESSRLTKIGGIDLTLLWEPVDRAKYKSFLWRSELYYVEKELPQNEIIKAYGLYTYGDYKFDRNWHAGIRFDYTQPFEIENEDKYMYQFVPYLTWWQSEFVRLRLQYNYLNGNNVDVDDQTMRLQITWAMGPHKHESY